MAIDHMEEQSCIFPAAGRSSASDQKRPLSFRVELQRPELLQQLFARDNGKVSLIAGVKAAWALVLRTYTGLDQVCFGLSEVGDTSIDSRGQGESIASQAVGDEMSLEQLVNYMGEDSSVGDQPKYDKFRYNTSALFRFAVQGGMKPGSSKTAAASMPDSCHLRLLVKVLKSGISLLLEYRSSYVSTEFAKSIASTTDKALVTVLSSPELKVREADLLSDRDRLQMEKWNSEPLVRVDNTIHGTIAEVTKRTPDAEAVASWDGSFTYRELDEHACQLAARLMELGVGAEVIVPLCFRKTRWNVVAMLGVLIAGGAFLPLDPAAPRERVEYLVKAVGAKTALCSAPDSHALEGLVDNLLAIDDAFFATFPPFAGRPQSQVDSHNAAYIIPTSGTTGVSKLSLLEHGNYCTGASAHFTGLAMDTKPLRCLQFAAHSFDASIPEILSALMFGGTTCIPNEGDRLNNISKVINDMRVTWACLTPTFVRFLEPSMVPTLATIILMGEAMSQANLDTWSQINLVNGYGPSECSVASSSCLRMQPTTDPKNIGFPIASHFWVVDPENRHHRLPIGCIGELLIEGHIAGRGYLGDEEKTAQAFVTDVAWAANRPFRGYLTGDLVVQRPDGGFTIAGRKDNQVKYHGQRIELLEIEHHLNLDASIKHNLVLLPKTGPCKERLVAVLSLAEHALGEPLLLYEGKVKAQVHEVIEAIRARISTRLPFYMLPTVWIAVTSLPLLASGKLDRKRTSQWLSAMSNETYQQAMPSNASLQSQDQPASSMEGALRSIWARVLNLPEGQIALNRAFLSLGGDSISAMQVMGQCRKQGISVGVQDILRSRSIFDLATVVKKVQIAVEDVVEDIDVPFDLTPIQSLWFQLPNQGHGHFNQSFYLKVTRRISVDVFRAAVEKIVSRHSMLRARFTYSDERGWQQRVTDDISNSYRFRHKIVRTKSQIDELIEDSQKCLNHATGPLLASDLFEVENEQHAFLVAHHLVIDLVSWRLILEELEEILTVGSLLPPALPFQKWALLQRDHAKTLQLDKVLPAAEVPPLDFGYWNIQHTDNTYGNASHASFELNPTLTSLFLGECHPALKTEPVEILLASLLHSWVKVFTDRPVPAIFNEGHGREPWNSNLDISRTVGWFTTVYPIAVIPAGDVIETVRMVKDFRRQIPSNGRPYFARRVLTGDGNAAYKTHWPMEISFNYLGQYQQLERTDALLQPLESMAGETRGAGGTADVGHASPRFGLFEISAIIFKGQLKFAFTFNRYMQHQDRIREWVSSCRQILEDMIQTLPTIPPRPTLSDFPLLSLNEERFQAMCHRLSKVGIQSSEIESAYPCSSMQEGLLLSQSKDAGFYAAVTVHELTIPNGPLEWETIAENWTRVVSRHPALRTIFLENVGAEEGLYDQVVLKRADSNLVHFNCSTAEEALQLIEQQRSVSYETGVKPPHRFTICNTTDGRIFCCLEISHAIMDGHSMSIIFHDLRAAYENELAEDGPLYADYIAYLMNQPQETSLQFWRDYLSGSEVCSFPVLNDGVVIHRRLQNIRVDCGSISILDLQAFCNAHRITLANIFHTAWALTLSLYVGSRDVTFGYLTSARDSEDIHGVQDMVGPIINTLVCRVQLSDGSRSLLDVIRDVQKDYFDAIPHRHIALAEVQHMLKDLAGASLFNTALSYRKLPPDNATNHDTLKFTEVAPIYDPTEYPVSINIEVSNEAAMIDLDFWTDHLSASQADNVASTFVRALENILHSAKQSLDSLNHLSGKHWQKIQEWNIIPDTIHECVHHRFQEWVKTQPDAPAIRGHDADYTYAELDAVTGRLAHYLVDLGVGPELFVPTCFDKSSFAVVAMLAVLKAGGAAVPLDAKHPKAALESRVDDTQAQVVLTTAARSELFEDIVPDVVIVDSVLLDDLSDVEGPACLSVQPHNPCFVIFTSGSTGKPKGVVLEHAAFATSANAHGEKLGIGRDTRFLQWSSYTFDNSLEEMFTTLQRGGCVLVPSEEDRMNDIAGAISRLGANIMDLTPTVASLIDPKDVPGIKTLGLGGEGLTQAVLDLWTPYVHVVGQYGPSEASVNSAFKDFKQHGEPSNIGKAVGSVSWIVDPDDRNRLVPIGCKGELLVEGPILARGYLQDPEKTRLAFIRDPAWARAGEGTSRRFYCTGDLVHYTGFGEMMYLGRKDSQVKLNGQRIELGEIEHHLKLALPSSAQSAVELVKFADAKGTKALVGFICLNDALISPESAIPAIGEMTSVVETQAKEVEIALANALPAYYVPSMFVPMTRMPMTTSGKLNRKILRQLAQGIPAESLHIYRLAGKSGRAPAGPLEVALARLWALVLNLPPDSIGADDSFFRLGGDSIGAMRLVTACRKEGMVLAVSNIFAQPKLADMAATISLLSSDELSAATEPEMVPFELIPEAKKQHIVELAASECGLFPDSIEDIYPCSRLQEGLIALSSKEPGSYVAETIYRLPSDIDVERFQKAWDKVFAEEAILRTRIIWIEDQGFLQVVVREGIEWTHLEDIQDMSNAHRHLPVIPGGPLASYTLVGQGTPSTFFVWTAHHAIYDGWSLTTLLNRVETYYHDDNQTSTVVVPYSRFIKRLISLDVKQSDAFWLSMFEDVTAPQFPQLPSPEYKVEASGQLRSHFLVTHRKGTDITMPSLVRAAWALLLGTFSGSDDVLWGETNSGRELPVPGMEDIVGPTITTSPMRLRLKREHTVQEYLQDVQRQTSAAIPHQFAGLQHIRKLSSDTAAACDFQSLLVIASGDSMKDPEGGLWHLESTGTVGTNFFNYGLIFNCSVDESGIEVEAHYDGQIIQPWLVQRLLHQFQFLVSILNAEGSLDHVLGDLDMLNTADQEAISSWNSRPVNIVNKCIHDSISRSQVVLRSTSIAIDAWDTGEITYREFDERTTRLASRLVSLGVKPQTYVPICFEKSGWTIVAMFAVMKCGAAFVPLDFESPLPRLREIVSNVQAALLLCGAQQESLCKSIPCKAVIVDREATDDHKDRLHDLPHVQSDATGYVMFTSGTSGTPKGAVISHRAFTSASAAFAPAFGFSEASRVLQFSSYTFDACLIEIFSTLIMGGTVCVPDQASRTNDLAGVVNRMRVSLACLTPSVVRMIHPSQVPGLKTLLLVGEAMSQHDLLTWADRVTLCNGYGPTECSAIATVNIMSPTSKPNNLGKVVTARGWVVSRDDLNHLVPVGAVGELLLEGGGVGSGYLNNPEKTAEAYVDRVGWTLGENLQVGASRRFYKTGDLVRYNEDGTLLYLGRKDNQTKVRGQRLEVQEVEHHLMQDPSVQNALVAVPKVGPCAKRLVGVVSLRDVALSGASAAEMQLLSKEAASFSIATTRERLETRLPSYMVPSLWVAITRFPLMPSAKMDRRRVVRWLETMGTDTYRRISTLGLYEPEIETEGVDRKLQTIFAKVLDLAPGDIRLNQSFLRLGGDSIAAMQVSSMCRAQGLAISVQDVVKSKSIAALAAVSGTQSKAVHPSQTQDYDLPFDLGPIQKLFFDTVGDYYNHFNQSTIFKLSRAFELEEIKAALEALVSAHPMLRARYFRDESGVWKQSVAMVPHPFRLQLHRVSSAKEEFMRPVIDETQASLDIVKGPVFAADLFDIDDNFSQAISLVAHHLVIDVVSWGIILDDLESLLGGAAPPPQSLPFHAWTRQQAAQARKDSAARIMPLTSIPPADFEYWGIEPSENLYGDVISEEFELSAKDSMLLLGAHDALSTEPVDVFIAALLESFRKVFPDRRAASIHNEGHGREGFDSQDLSRTVGWFTTMTPIHLPVALEDQTDIVSTIRWVSSVRERTPDKGRPYFAHRILTGSGQDAFASHWPAEISFNYLGRMQNMERKNTPLQRVAHISTTDISANTPRLALFEITALVKQGTIKLSFDFNRHVIRHLEIKRWITECKQTLVDAIDQLLQLRSEPSLDNFKLLPLIYNGMSKLSVVLPAGTMVEDIEDIYPASPMQQGMLLSQLKHPELYSYHCIMEVRSTVPGLSVNPRKIAQAWQIVVQRHPILRTVFIESLSKTGVMDQVVFRERPGRIAWVADCDTDSAARLLRQQPLIDFRDFNSPHRLTICQTKTNDLWVKLEMSHAICDGSSIPIILNDLARAYEHKLSRTDVGPLYSSFVAHTLTSNRDADLNFWRAYLAGIEPCFFPVLHDGVPGPHEVGSYELHVQDLATMQAFCKKFGVTLSTVIQLSWTLLLHIYTGQSDVSFGVVASGRDAPVKGIDEAVGCFVNMLICRLELSDESTVHQLLMKLQDGGANALAHQGCSLADVQHELQLPSLFNTVFTFQRRQLSRDPTKTALAYENVEAADPGEFQITVNVDVSDEGATIDFGFWKDKVHPLQAQNMVDAFDKILGSILMSSDRDVTITDLDMFTESSLEQIMQWNAELPSPVRRRVHDLIQEQVLLRPRSTKAIESAEVRFTYQEFDEVTTKLALHLQSLGVGPETFVPILFEKSPWAPVAMIAIMKAGGAYVPLDPKHPPNRLRELIGDVGAKVALCSRLHHPRASEVVSNAVIVDRLSLNKLPLAKGMRLKSNATPDNAVYVLFTSGTTGKPKGTIISHEAFCTSAIAFTRGLGIDHTSRTFNFASYTFDASCIEILSALMVGATVCVPTEDERMSDPSGAIRRMKATWSLLTPSVLSTLKASQLQTLKILAAGGEAVPAAEAEKWQNNLQFVIAYGPTETAVVASTIVKSADIDGRNIGHASGCRLWVVHPRNHDNLMPLGAIGELVIEGYTVARGYLGDEAKTAKSFISNPAWASQLRSEHGGLTITRMYKSGDLVRYNPDGTISYIGRKDTQIKLNGRRIELSEIEHHVSDKFPDNVQSAVELVAPASRTSAKALAVFFALNDDPRASSEVIVQPASSDLPQSDELLRPMDKDLRNMCQSLENALVGALPAYMIPTIFLPMKKLPWTPAGKLDRNRLRALVQNLSKETVSPYRLANTMHKRKPKTEAEKRLQKLVSSVLNLPLSSVGADDSFIRLGGDSVAAMRLVGAAQAEHLNLTVMDVFKQPRISDLAAKCHVSETNSKANHSVGSFKLLPRNIPRNQMLQELSEICRVSHDQIQDVYPTSPLQEAFVALSIKQPGAYVAQHVLSLAGSIDVTKFKAAWERTVQEIDLLRTRVAQLQSGAFVQAVLVEDPVVWRKAKTLEEAESEAANIPAYLGGKLASYTIVHTATSERYFIWTIHHAIYDGWSIALMLQRVQEIYQVGSSSIPRVPYTRFIQYLLNNSPDASTTYWKHSLAGAAHYQFPQQQHSNFSGAPDGQTLQHTAKLSSLRHSDITLPNFIRAAWALLLSVYTGSNDVVFGETLNGRDVAVPGVTEICGPALTTVPTRVVINRDTSVVDLLRSIAQCAWDRIPHQHFGLSEIKRIDEDTAAACDFQNLLIIQTGSEEPADSMWSHHNNGVQGQYFTYPLVIECEAHQTSLHITAYHDANVISSWEVQRILYQFDSVLRQLNAVGNIRDVHVFSEKDAQFVRSLNTAEPVVVNDTIPSLFFKQAASTPDKEAVAAWDGALSYRKLRDLASQLAQELLLLGTGPEDLVPICVDKSCWAVVAILGVLISGAGYVPLSPDHPISRHRQIIQECNASIVLCSTQYESRFSDLVGRVLPISEASIRQLPTVRTEVELRATPDTIAYVLYTSGSTGVPKGVTIEHRAIASSSAAMCKALNIKPSSRLFQFASFVFDVSVLEILTALSCGATVCVPSEESRLTDITSAINTLRATWTCLTPSVANVIESAQSVPTLETFASAADPLTPDTIKKWSSSLQLLNAYGPTEASVIALSNAVSSSPRESTIIGRALQSGRAWITNQADPNQLAPVGAIGELCLEGPFLARNYYKNPAKTAEVFIEKPRFMDDFFKGSPIRIYRTGDLVKYDSAGKVHYLGRRDNQIKLAGQRMELGEIEHHLQADKTIKQAVVLMPKSGAAKRKLVAVVSYHRMPADAGTDEKPWNTPLSHPDLLRQIGVTMEKLSDLVPAYMVPTLWIAVPRIPALASAKLDKKQVGAWLGDMDDETYRGILDMEGSLQPAMPGSDAVLKMQGIWSQVLNVPVAKVQPNKSWLSLGGDSIMAMQLLARARKEGINITMNQVLRSKSLAHLAESVGTGIASEAGKELLDQPFALSPIQRFYFSSLGDDKNSQFNQSFTLRLAHRMDPAKFKDGLDAIVQCHSMLRARFLKSANGEWLQMIPSKISSAYTFSIHDGIELSDLPAIILRAQQGLDIVNGPVFAATLFTTQSGEQIIFLAAHHLVVDVVSWRIILEDLEELLTSPKPVRLQKGLPFPSWNEKQISHTVEFAQMEIIKEQDFHVEPADLAFWGLEQSQNVYGNVEREAFSLDDKFSTMAFDSHHALRTDVIDIFVAAIAHSFSRIFIARTTPTIFNETHGREPWEFSNLDLSRTVGWLTSLYPVHVAISEDEDDVIHTVRQVKDLRRNVADNGRPYFAHRFLTSDGPTRYAEHEPMEVLFNYLGKMQQLEAADALFQPMQFSEEDELRMADTGSTMRRLALFEISASVNGGRIQFSFMYNRLMKNQKGIRRWILECQRTLEEIITSLTKIDTPQPTISDFPLLPLDSYDRLNSVIKSLVSVGATYPEVEDMYPCAAVQEGMMLSQIKDPNAYWSFTTFELKAKGASIDTQRVLQAWKKVVERHPALRTVFVDSVCKGGVFDQIVLRAPDTGALIVSCRDAELSAKLDSIRYRDLNGKRKPHLPHQFAVVQTTSGRTIVKMEINHAVVDGGSLAIIRHDLEQAYEGRLSQDEGPLYSEYIKHLRSLPMKAAIDFWKAQLQGVRPCYFPITPQHSSKQRQLHSLFVDFDQFSEIQSLAEKNNVTFSNIILSAWSLLLHTYTGSSEVCYGYLTSGRNIPINDVEKAVGAFINMLVSRTKISNSLSFLSICEKVQNDFIESLPYQYCSLAQFQHDLGLSGQALFNTAVSVQNQGATEDPRKMDTTVEFVHLDGGDPSEFAITVNINTTRNDECVRLAYWTDSVSDYEAKNVSTLLVKILTLALADPKQTVAELDAAITVKSRRASRFRVYTPSIRSPMTSPHLEVPDPMASAPVTPRIELPQGLTSSGTNGPDWGNLIRSIVSEMVPQIVSQVLEKNKLPSMATHSTVSEMTSQMAGMLARKASQSLRGRNLETGSIRSRRMSTASETGSRIQTAADMVAAAGVMATETLKSVPPDFVEKKLLGLWSDLLDMVEDSIDRDDSFFQLGGDSIIAMRLVGAAREEGLSMTVADVFKNPTFADMARVVRVAGEVIDEVMSRAGGESLKDAPASSSKPKIQIPERTVTAWRDFQSMVSEQALDDKTTDGGITPPAWPERQLQEKTEQVFKKWSGFAQNSRPQATRRNSPMDTMPQTIHEETAPKSVSLLGDPNVDSVISKVQVFKGGISDVLPVTDFQALAITGTLLESRWMLNHFYLEGEGPLDLRKLKQACLRIVQAFDILRTVFVPYGDRFLQVVLRKLQPDFIYHETDQSLDEFTANLRQKDRENGPRLGEAFVQFVVAKQKGNGLYRIIMRLSHAQYDGFCFGRILESLQAGYNGLAVSSTPSFGNYVRETAKTVTGAYDHWREVLRGSKMTEIVPRYGPNYQRSAGRTLTLKQTLTVPPLSHINITTATVMKAAWAATLARIAGKSDIVFGHVISGRNSGVPNVEKIIGPCLNMIPVRVVYRPEWTVLDLLGYIQEQQINNMPYESLGFREITKNCTDWPDWSNFSSVIQHNQNIPNEDASLQLGGIKFKLGAVASQEDFADISILSTSKSGEKVELVLTYAPNTTLTADFTQNIFDMLCANVISFSEDPYPLLPAQTEMGSQSSTTITSESARKKSAEKQPLTLPTDTGLTRHELSALADTLRGAWEQNVRDENNGPPALDLSSDFFQLGGDIMGLAQIASILDHEHGWKVRVEDLLDKPLFVDQVRLLATERKKQIEKEEMSPWGEKVNIAGRSTPVDKAGLGRRESGLGALARKIGLKRKDTPKGVKEGQPAVKK